MIVFYQLLLAHLITDFPLQFNELYRLKVESKIGVLLHCTIVVVISILLLSPYLLEIKIWLFIFALGIGHLAIDYEKIMITNKTGADNLWLFLLDQVLHILLIGLISFGISLLRPTIFPGLEFFCDKAMLLTLCGYIFAGFGAVVLIHYLLRAFFEDYSDEIFAIKTYGVIERMVIISLILLEGHVYLFIPVVLLLRLRFPGFEKRKFIVLELICGTTIALTCGLLLKYFVWS